MMLMSSLNLLPLHRFITNLKFILNSQKFPQMKMNFIFISDVTNWDPATKKVRIQHNSYKNIVI